jgi:hypothetical protein
MLPAVSGIAPQAFHMKLSSLILAALSVAIAACATSPSALDGQVTVASQAPDGPPPPPASTASMADPGVYLQDDTFYAFATGSGLRLAASSTAGGPWAAPTDVLDPTNLPAWVDTSKAIWAPDMIQDAQGDFVVYFAAALNRSAGTPTGADAPASAVHRLGEGKPSARYIPGSPGSVRRRSTHRRLPPGLRRVGRHDGRSG